VAKAFRIGANLVLTKPINIEQAKGTLRVARGLLRKGDPAKPAAPGATAAVPANSAAAPKTSASAPAAPVARPAASAVKPSASARPAPAATASMAASASAVAKPEPVLPEAKQTTAHAPNVTSSAAPAFSVSSGAASAPAPAREILDIPPTEVKPPAAPSEDDNILEAPEAATSSASAKDVPAPSFTFGGANAPRQSGGSKKIFVGIAAAVVVAGALYGGWTYYQGHKAQPAPAPFVNPIRPVTTPSATPSNAQPAAPAPAPAATAPTPQPTTAAPASSAVTDHSDSGEETPAPAPTSSKAKGSASAPAAKPAPAPEQPEEAPIMVKGGNAPAQKAAAADADAAAPSMIGIATPGSNTPLNLGGAPDDAKPVLQRLNISQGVSRGLLIKKVDPVYPASALHMRIEGAVQLVATISKSGEISRVQVLSGDKQLSAAAVDAVKRWKYKPYLLNGEPVDIDTQITINFKLPQ
jgi:protein TonB